MPSILFLGATGYIGSAVFNAFINAHPAFEYSALVRTPSHSSHIRTVNTIIGTLEDRSLLTDLARKADIVVNVARADDIGMVEAVIEGLRQRKQECGNVPSLIHTCGGDTFEGRDVWDDIDEECTRALLGRQVEQAIIRAQNEDVLQAYFIAPTVVYGLNPYEKPSPFYLQIIRELLSLPKPSTSPLPFPSLTFSSVQASPGRAMGMVHIDDLANLYLLVLDKILRVRGWSTPVCEDPMSRVYIASVYERSRTCLYNDVLNSLVARHVLPSDIESTHKPHTQPVETTPPEKHFYARRAPVELGWEPSKLEWRHDMDWDIKRALEVLKVTRSTVPVATVT